LPKVIQYLNGDNNDYVKFAIVVLRTYLANLVQDKESHYLTENSQIIDRLMDLLSNIINDFNMMVKYILSSLKSIG
jgi:hypothetical protein